MSFDISRDFAPWLLSHDFWFICRSRFWCSLRTLFRHWTWQLLKFVVTFWVAISFWPSNFLSSKKRKKERKKKVLIFIFVCKFKVSLLFSTKPAPICLWWTRKYFWYFMMAKNSLPPGFRFHPTDVELVWYYLKRKIIGKSFQFDAISEVELYKFAPWDLPGNFYVSFLFCLFLAVYFPNLPLY